jgi:hypothetical protein
MSEPAMKYAGQLTYGVRHMYWYAEKDTQREVWLTYRSAEDPTVQGSLTFELVKFGRDGDGGSSVECRIFSDAWLLWQALPDLFHALALKKPATLEQLTAVLDAFGAEDATAYEHPGIQGPALKAVREFERCTSPDNARAAAEALIAFADRPIEVPF